MVKNTIQQAQFTNELTNWQRFILRHSDPLNLKFHFVSWLMFFSGLLLPVVTGNPWWLLAFFLSGSVGALGHRISGEGDFSLTEGTIDIRIPFYVTVMFYRIWKGIYFEEVKSLQEIINSSSS
jgi:hypothetical protein